MFLGLKLLTSEPKQEINNYDVQYEERMETLVDISAACEVYIHTCIFIF
jgi:hypothetical protein